MEVGVMRALVILFVATALLLVNTARGSAVETHVGRDSVRGTATHLGADPPFPRITVRIRASSDADGSNPRGDVTIRVPDIGQQRRGNVTCLNVHGNTATIGIEIVKAEDPTVVGKGELWNVVDNGGSGDQIAGFALTEAPPTVCPPLSFSVPVVAGDYQILDATP
jgi:hypothetical protein